MVIFGGLELVAAGYLLHEHSKNKKERLRIEEEEEAIERERRRNRRHHSADRRRHHSHERKYSQSHEYEDVRPSRPQNTAPLPSAMKPYPVASPYSTASPYLAPTAQPVRANSAPPPQQPLQPQDQYYPPTGWPSTWEQSQRPDPLVNGPGPREAGPLPVKYGWRPDQDHDTYAATSESRRRGRGRSDPRPSDSPAQRPAALYQQPQVSSPHVRFALPSDRMEPPPAYSR